MDNERYFHWLVTVKAVPAFGDLPAIPVRTWWSGSGELSFGGETYEGTWSEDSGALVEVSAVQNEVGDPSGRVRFIVALTPESLIALSQTYFGIPSVTIEWITSIDAGKTWTRIPRKFTGKVSLPKINADGRLAIEVESFTGDTDQGVEQYWSDESHQQRHPGDLFFSHVRNLTERGKELRWLNV